MDTSHTRARAGPGAGRGPWALVLGPWALVLGTWYLVLGTWYLVLGTWYLVLGNAVRGRGVGFVGQPYSFW